MACDGIPLLGRMSFCRDAVLRWGPPVLSLGTAATAAVGGAAAVLEEIKGGLFSLNLATNSS